MNFSFETWSTQPLICLWRGAAEPSWRLEVHCHKRSRAKRKGLPTYVICEHKTGKCDVTPALLTRVFDARQKRWCDIALKYVRFRVKCKLSCLCGPSHTVHNLNRRPSLVMNDIVSFFLGSAVIRAGQITAGLPSVKPRTDYSKILSTAWLHPVWIVIWHAWAAVARLPVIQSCNCVKYQ